MVKLPAPSVRSIQPSGLRADHIDIGMAIPKARIWLMRMSSRSMGRAARMVAATDV